MCLITTSKKPKIARKNIVCYKILFGNETPYMSTKVNKLHLWGILPFRAKHKIVVESFDLHRYSVGDGMIHTYQTIEEALRMQKQMNSRFACVTLWPSGINPKGTYFYTIYKCIIPIGTRYYQSSLEKTYASRKIRFIKKM